jgi:hypothetical protein
MRSNLLDKMDYLSLEGVGAESQLANTDYQLTTNACNRAADVLQTLLETIEDVEAP